MELPTLPSFPIRAVDTHVPETLTRIAVVPELSISLPTHLSSLLDPSFLLVGQLANVGLSHRVVEL
jgi:hypothetical protein